MRPAGGGSWLLPLTGGQSPRARIVGFPHCGGGPSLFRGWGRDLPDCEVWGAELPGHERRLGEPCETSWVRILDTLLADLAAAPPLPTVLAGHSLGALVAFEVARRLELTGTPPLALVVSACAAPQLPRDAGLALTGLDDEGFLSAVSRYGGLPAELLADPEMRAAILPVLRADFGLCDSYVYAAGRPLQVPISAFGGAADAMVGRSAMDAWRQQTARRFSLNLLPGDHFYLKTNPWFGRALAREVAAVL